MKNQIKYCRLRKGDEVQVLAGRSKGTTGKVESFDRKRDRVFVSGVNIAKKHTKASMSHPDGGIVDKPMSIHISNVAYYDAKAGKPSRIRYATENGKKVRVAVKSGTPLV